MTDELKTHPDGPLGAGPVDIVAAQAAIEADRTQRAETAAREIRPVLARYRCQVVATPQLTPDGRITAAVQIVAQILP